ncbi:MAG: hypothetical protein H8E49_08850 [Gammaproteobacteria bacterium]|nr:hypothetical protein [Gammaproteobacteria bacterium]
MIACQAVNSVLQATFEGWRQTLTDVPAAAIVVDHYAESGSKCQDLARGFWPPG